MVSSLRQLRPSSSPLYIQPSEARPKINSHVVTIAPEKAKRKTQPEYRSGILKNDKLQLKANIARPATISHKPVLIQPPYICSTSFLIAAAIASPMAITGFSLAEPTAIGTIRTFGLNACRNGTCTSSECS